MHPYLTRLNILAEVQDFFSPFHDTDGRGNLCFNYGNDTEIYGLAYHRVPATSQCWIAGPRNFALVRQVIICSSAMEAFAWLTCHINAYRSLDYLLFIATGSRITHEKLTWVRNELPGHKYGLLFGNDLLGKICDLKAAAALHGLAVKISGEQNGLSIHFRYRCFRMDHQLFSLNAFSRLSGFRFGVQTLKPAHYCNWLDQLNTQ